MRRTSKRAAAPRTAVVAGSPRVVVCHPRQLPRDAMVSELRGSGMDVVGEATTAEATLLLARRYAADIALVHARLRDEQAVARLVEGLEDDLPTCRTVVFGVLDMQTDQALRTDGAAHVFLETDPIDAILALLLDPSPPAGVGTQSGA